MKTIFTILLSIFSACTVTGYPFEPKQFMLLEAFVIGISSVLLALEPNNERIKGDFLKTVLVKSAPSALVMFLPVLIVMILGMTGVGISSACRNAVAVIVVTLVGLVNLIFLCRPYTKWRWGVLGIVCAGIAIVGSVGTFALNDMFVLKPVAENPLFLLGMLGLGISLALLLQLFRTGMENFLFGAIEKLGGLKGKNKAKK
jgi:cation-transporting ATPase E